MTATFTPRPWGSGHTSRSLAKEPNRHGTALCSIRPRHGVGTVVDERASPAGGRREEDHPSAATALVQERKPALLVYVPAFLPKVCASLARRADEATTPFTLGVMAARAREC
ncbi:MAG TPA: hypothetical protein VHJ17_04975 [Thermomonospora sp.]|nr:hypothetical protein [Thermomonospora sp.]